MDENLPTIMQDPQVDEFLSKLGELAASGFKPYIDTSDGDAAIRLEKADIEWCPITAVSLYVTGSTFDMDEYDLAGASISIDEATCELIVAAADGDSYALSVNMDIDVLREAMLKVLNLS
jgi:hypothetical protein